MRIFAICLLATLSSGCAPSIKFETYPPGHLVKVTSAYSTRSHQIGSEFNFSLKLPVTEGWTYAPAFQAARKGRIGVEGQKSGRGVYYFWEWFDRSSPHTQKDIREGSPLLPWYSGKKAALERTSYEPTSEQIKSGDWFSVGYPQRMFHQAIYRGSKSYYCVRTLIRRGGRTTWAQQHQVPEAAGYTVYDVCPFRTTDGRDAFFRIETTFFVTKEMAAKDPTIVDRELAAIDRLLQPSWDSLEVMPQAYQFDPPVTAPVL